LKVSARRVLGTAGLAAGSFLLLTGAATIHLLLPVTQV